MKSLLLRVVILPSNILPQALDPSRSPRGFQVQGGACKTDRFHGKNIRSQPRLSHLKLRPYPPIFDMKTVAKDLSLSRFTFRVKVQHLPLIMMIVFYESTVLTSGPMIGFLDREKILSEPSVPYVNLSDRS